MTNIYTLIAHRDSGYHDRTGSSPSQLVQKVFKDREELIECAAKLQFDNHIASRKDWGRCDFEFTVYLNGVDRREWWNIFSYAEDEDGTAEAGDDDLSATEDAIEARYKQLIAENTAMEAAAAEQKKRDEEEAEERDRLAAIDREKALLATLIEKHGHPAYAAQAGE